METNIKLTVFFEGIFWVGVFERTCQGKYEVTRVVFGAEPKDYEVYDFILHNFYKLKFSSPEEVDPDEVKDKKINPKRLQREIRKETECSGVGTKAKLAMKLQYEDNKTERKKNSKEEKEAEKDRKFQLREEKKLKKHRGH